MALVRQLSPGCRAGLHRPAHSRLRAACLRLAAREPVRAEALRLLGGRHGGLCLACGGFLGMNGNYAAGVLEGLAHLLPEVGEWIGAEDWRTLAARDGGWHPCA